MTDKKTNPGEKAPSEETTDALPDTALDEVTGGVAVGELTKEKLLEE